MEIHNQGHLFLFADVVRNDENLVGGPCRAEMDAHRKMLMEDYSISPEVVAKCGKHIQVNTFVSAK